MVERRENGAVAVGDLAIGLGHAPDDFRHILDDVTIGIDDARAAAARIRVAGFQFG